MAYRLRLPTDWKIHPVFHVSLLKPWKQSQWQQVDPEATTSTTALDLEYEPGQPATSAEEILETEKLIRWRRVRRGSGWSREFLVLWKGSTADDLEWVAEERFVDPRELEADIARDHPSEEP